MTRSAPRLTLMAAEDLKCELFELKKRLHDTASENYLLKVKVRKLQTEVDKKNKQIECLLDPKKSVNVRKIISERGATMIINLKQRNTDLEQALMAKDVYIRKLQTIIDTSKVYSVRETFHKHTTAGQRSYDSTNAQGGNLRSRSLSVTPTPKYSTYLRANSDVQLECVRLAQNLQKIKLAHQRPSSQISLKPDNEPPEHIDVDEYLANMITEMDKMKETIAELSAEQDNMKKVLKEKNSNIEILAKRVRHLQRRKYKKYSRSASKKPEPEVANGIQDAESTNIHQTTLQNNNSEQNKRQKSKEQTKTYTEDSFEEPQTSMSNDLSSASTSSSKINENNTNTDDDDDDDVQTGDSIND